MASTPSDSAVLVLDSWPLLEWLKGRQSADLFQALLLQARAGDRRLLLDRLNLGEVYYLVWKHWGRTRAEELLLQLTDLPIQISEATPQAVMEAARVKAVWNVSYADAFTASLAIRFDVPVLTGDPDFLRLRDAGLLRVEWIGR